jgi:hypothetical protein
MSAQPANVAAATSVMIVARVFFIEVSVSPLVARPKKR